MKSVNPSQANGSLRAPASKSAMQRAVAAALLSKGKSIITNPSYSDDGLASIGIAKALGASVEQKENQVIIHGSEKEPQSIVDCFESGLCMRMFSPIAALFEKEITLTGKPQLLGRPIGFIEEPLRTLGAHVQTVGGFPPVKVRGKLKGGRANVDCSVSSQHLTGLLLSLPLCEKDSVLTTTNLASKEYVDLTLSIAKEFGVKISVKGNEYSISGKQKYAATNFEVEGDWSGASFMLVAGAICGKVKVTGLRADSNQPDRHILDALKSAGCELKTGADYATAQKSSLNAFSFDATGCPDLFPPLVALACNCEGISEIKGVSRLQHKETDRAKALFEEFSAIGAKISFSGEKMLIEGCKLRGGTVKSRGDHRIAMAAAIAALNSQKKVEIMDSNCVSKSYPNFFEDLKSLGVKM